MYNVQFKEFFISIEDTNLSIISPYNDDTIYGTIESIRENFFKINEINFKDGDYFIDLGCNIGLLSCYVAKKFPFVRVLSFDASPISIGCLKVNIFKNELSNIQVFHKAIGGKTEKNIKFYSNNKEISTLIEEKLDTEDRKDFYYCDKVDILDLLESPVLGIDKVKYLKIDIEGSEFEVFDSIFKKNPDILNKIEYLNLEIHKRPEEDFDGLKNKLKFIFKEKYL